MKRKTLLAIGALALCSPCFSQDSSIYMSVEGSGAPLMDADQPVGTFTQSDTQLENKNAQTVSQALETDTNLSFQKGGSGALMELTGIRGFESASTAVTYDGMRLASDITGNTDLSVINPSELNGLAVYSGTASPLSGSNSQGGVINLSTLSPFGPNQAQADASLGDFNTGDYSVKARGGEGDFGFAVSGGRRYSSGFQQNGDYSGDDITASAGWKKDGIGVFKVEAMDSMMDTGLPQGTPAAIGTWNGIVERQANSLTDWQDTERRLLGASYDSALEGPVQVSAKAWESSNNITYNDYGIDTLRTYLNAAYATASINKRTSFTAEYQDENMLSDTYGNHDRKTNSLGAETRLDLAGNVEFVPGVRYDNPSAWSDQLCPRGVLIWKPQAGWKISASAGRGWMAPTFADMYDPYSPNPNVKPEHSMQYDAGAQMETLAGLTASMSVFYSDIDDKIALDPNNNYAAYNLDEARIAGVQPQLKFKYGTATHTVSYSYIHNDSKQQTGGWQTASMSPENRFSYTGEFKATDTVGFNMFVRYVSQEYTGLGRTGDMIPAFTTADASLVYNPGSYSVTLSVLNLTDAHYAENADTINGYYPMPGRNFRISANVKL